MDDANENREKDGKQYPEYKVDKEVQARVIVVFDIRRLTRGFDGSL